MKSKDKAGGIQNRHVYSRISYLYQAAAFLDKASHSAREKEPTYTAHVIRAPKLGSGSSRLLISHLRNVSQKSQIRLATTIKHSACKRCHNILDDRTTLETYVENKSKNGKKPWADVLIHECTQCGFIRRFPVGARKQARRQACNS